MTKKAYVYCRVSTKDQKSIPEQEKECQAYAKKNGYKVVKVFKDQGFTATADNRPEFLEMVDSCKDSEIAAVILCHTDRFARNEYDHAIYKSVLNKDGTDLIALEQPMINDTPEGHLIDSVMAGINAYYSRDLSRKTKRGMNRRFDSGWWPGWAPLGYVNIKGGKLSRKFYSPERQKYYDELAKQRPLGLIEQDPTVAPLIKEAFMLYSTGNYSISRLVEFLSEKGLKNRDGSKIVVSLLHNILRNPFYYGLVRWGNKEINGLHEPLISKELFDACQYVAAKHRQFLTRERKHDFLLRGLIFCPIHKIKRIIGRENGTEYVEDDQRFTAEFHFGLNSKKRDKISYYHCAHHGGCPKSYIETEVLESLVAQELKKYEFNPEFIKLVKQKVKEITEVNHRDTQSRIRGLENQKRDLENKQSKLLDLLLEGEINKNSLERKQTEIENQIEEIESKISEAKSNLKIDFKLVEEVLSLTQNIYQTYMEAPDFLKKHYLRVFIEKIFVSEGKIVKIIENPIFSMLREQEQVLIKGNLLPS